MEPVDVVVEADAGSPAAVDTAADGTAVVGQKAVDVAAALGIAGVVAVTGADTLAVVEGIGPARHAEWPGQECRWPGEWGLWLVEERKAGWGDHHCLSSASGGRFGGSVSKRAVGCRKESGRDRPVFGLVARTSFASIGGFLLWHIGWAKFLKECRHFSLGDRIILVTCALLGHLQDGVAILIRDHSVSLIPLIPSEVPAKSVEVPGNLHGSGGEAVPDRSISDLSSGQKLLDLDHCVPLVEGRSHTKDNSPSLGPGLRCIVSHKYSFHAAVKGKCLEHCGDHFCRVAMGREAKGLAELWNATQEKVSCMTCLLLLVARPCGTIVPFLLKGIPL